jgi:phosphoribosylaminoimidazole carboxylase
MLSSAKIGVLGGGQLGRMLMEAANRLNIQMNVLDTENAPAKQISAHDGHITGSFTDRASLRKLAEACDILTTEIEHVDTYGLEEVASKVKVEPSWETIRIIQDKFHQKEYLSKFNIPMAEYRELRRNSTEELTVIGEELGYPLMLKSKTQAYDGRGKREACSLSTLIFMLVYGLRSAIGNYRVPTQADIPSALEALKGRPLYAEKWANFRMVRSKFLGFMQENPPDARA